MTQSKSTYFTYPTAHGPITICSDGKGITAIEFENCALAGTAQATELTNRAATQIQEYLAGKRTTFDIPINPHGSAFQKEVWNAVCTLPYGTSLSAADIADLLGKPSAHRSVGTAIRRNPIPILIPTHRVDLPNATGKKAKIFRALRALEQRNASVDAS